jgi:hypothetical protein
MNITINQNDNQNIGISNRNTQDIIVNNNEIQTIRVESNTPQTLGINQNENQLILIGGGGAVIGITDVLVNGVTVVSGNIAYVTVPTKTSELTNNSGFITSETDPTVPSYVKQISLADINNWNSKQEELVSGSNIKTINSTSLLGSGNIDITGGESYTAGTGINIENGVISNTITNYNDLTDLPTIPNKTSDLVNDEDFVSEDDLSEVAFTGSYNSLSDTPVIPDSTSELTNDSGFIDNTVNDLTNYMLTSDINTALNNKQDTLVSGTNIKTINSNSILGSGDLVISGGTPTDVKINGTSITSNNEANIITESAYNSSTNKIATIQDIPIKSFIQAVPSADVNIPTGAYTEINNLSSQYSRGNLTISNGKIKIGSGINYVKVTATLGINCNGDDLYSFFTKNGTSVGTWVVSTISSLNSTIREDIIPVSENDLISLNIYLGNGGTIVSNRTSIIVESI